MYRKRVSTISCLVFHISSTGYGLVTGLVASSPVPSSPATVLSPSFDYLSSRSLSFLDDLAPHSEAYHHAKRLDASPSLSNKLAPHKEKRFHQRCSKNVKSRFCRNYRRKSKKITSTVTVASAPKPMDFTVIQPPATKSDNGADKYKSAAPEAPAPKADDSANKDTSKPDDSADNPTYSDAPTNKPADSPPSGDSSPKSGDATYYGTGLGACGIVSNDNSMIAAASHLLFDSFPGATANPNLNPICGRKVRATYEGKSVEVEIVDRCTGCALHDLDFSPAAFAHLGPMEKGRLHEMKWEWI